MSLLKNEYVIKDISKNFLKNRNIDNNVNHLCKEVGEFVGLGAHNQRSLIKVEVQLSKDNFIFLEDIIKNVENQASVPTFPILKRPDERWVTEKGYNNPKFSEDIARDLQIMLQKDTRILAWSLKVENEESIHPFNVMSSSKSKNWNFY
jgi:GTP cyclohydrolase I